MESVFALVFSFEHVLIAKPVSTFAEHAPCVNIFPSQNRFPLLRNMLCYPIWRANSAIKRFNRLRRSGAMARQSPWRPAARHWPARRQRAWSQWRTRGSGRRQAECALRSFFILGYPLAAKTVSWPAPGPGIDLGTRRPSRRLGGARGQGKAGRLGTAIDFFKRRVNAPPAVFSRSSVRVFFTALRRCGRSAAGSNGDARVLGVRFPRSTRRVL